MRRIMEKVIEKAKGLNKKVVAIGAIVIVIGAGTIYMHNNTIPDPTTIKSVSDIDKYYNKVIKVKRDEIIDLVKEEVAYWELDDDAKYHFCKDKDIVITTDNQSILVRGIVYINDVIPKEFKASLLYDHIQKDFFVRNTDIIGE